MKLPYVTALLALGAALPASAGYSWTSANNTTNLYSAGTGQGIQNSVAIGGTSSGGNAAHVLQGADIQYEAYDKNGTPLTLTLADLTFNSNWMSSGQQFTTNIDITGYVKITYNFATDWVSNQNSSSQWNANVSGSFSPFGVESKFTFVSDPNDYFFTASWWQDGTQLDPTEDFLRGQKLTHSASLTDTDNTGIDGTGTGNYVHGILDNTAAAGDGIEWHGDFDLDPYANGYDQNIFYIYPTGNATNGTGESIISAGTQFGITTNGAVLTPIPEPTSGVFLTLSALLFTIRRKRA